ncbi:unnamed protein product [Victoria cruziana]
MVVHCGTTTPVLFKWFVSRDVAIGAPSSNGMIILIPIPSFPFLVYLHSKKFICSMDREKSGVLVRTSHPILLPDNNMGRSSSKIRARNVVFCFVHVLHFLFLKSMGDFSYLESFRGVLRLLFSCTLFFLPCDRSACPGHHHDEIRGEGFGPVAFPINPSSGGACGGGVPPEIGLEALALPTSRLRVAVGHNEYQKAPMNLPISHGGVCICLLGVLLLCDPAFTQRLPFGFELHMGLEHYCLRGLDRLHGPTSHSICGNLIIYKPSLMNNRLIFEHDESLHADLLPIHFLASYGNGKLDHFLHRWMKNCEHKNLWLTMFPERRYFFFKTTSMIEVAIHTNPFMDPYAPIGTGSSGIGVWYATIMKLPFIFCIWIGFMLALSGGSCSMLCQLQKEKLHWNRESSIEFIIA